MVQSDETPDLAFSCKPVETARNLNGADRIYCSDSKNKYGESAVQLFRHSDTEIMRFPRIADFFISPGSIECDLLAPRIAYMVEICLLGHVLAYTLERAGVSPIHGASLDFDGRAAILIGDSGAGKSTLAASMLCAGVPLVADDIAALEIRDTAAFCRPGYPQIKLTPEQAHYFAGSTDGYEKVHQDFQKLGVPVADLGTFTGNPLPVGGIYILERTDAETDTPVQLVPLSQAESLKELLKNSFITEIVDTTDMRVPRLQRLARTVRILRVTRLRYPGGYDRLPEVLRAVRADLG